MKNNIKTKSTQAKSTSTSSKSIKKAKKVPYENNGVKLCIASYSERKKFVKECPPFQIVDGKMKQMRCRHTLVLPKEPKKPAKPKNGKLVKMDFGSVMRQAA